MTREEIREGLIEFFNPPNTVRQSGTILDDNIKGVVDELLKYLHSQGVVIKVDRELPDNPFDADIDGDWESKEEETYYVGKSNGFETCKSLIIKAGYVAVEPLITKEVSNG